MSRTITHKLTRIVDCGQKKYTVEIDELGVSVLEDERNQSDAYCIRFVDVPAFHAAAIADAIVSLTAEFTADLAKLREVKP